MYRFRKQTSEWKDYRFRIDDLNMDYGWPFYSSWKQRNGCLTSFSFDTSLVKDVAFHSLGRVTKLFTAATWTPSSSSHLAKAG
ncbi:hypothetical protein AAC387_Pa03g3331 [Persea americana]